MKLTSAPLASRTIVYLLMFLFTLHITPITYIESSFLSKLVSTAHLGFIFAVASLTSIIAFLYIRPLLRTFGNYKTFLTILGIECITLLIMMLSTSAFWVIGAFIVGYTMRNIAFFNLDIFLEHFSKNQDTGSIRGIYLTVSNLSYIIGPFVTGIVLQRGAFVHLFIISTCMLFIVFMVAVRYMHTFRDPIYQQPDIKKTARAVFANRDMRSIFAIDSLLRFFYAWMIIYAPIYLNQHIGFTLSETTFIISFALVAFVILQAPLGYLADRFTGEKEFLILGFCILASATISLSFITSNDFWVWVGALFVTRIGASMVEAMAEAYFFKKIDSSDLNIISFFRMIRPFVYLAPLFASLLLIVIDIKYLFLVLGIIMLYGIQHSLALRDTL
jgi:MFS family permease